MIGIKKKYELYLDESRRLYYLKNEYRRVILQAIVRDRTVKPITRGFIYFKKHTTLPVLAGLARQRSVCFKRSHHRGIYKWYWLGRHYMVKLGMVGMLQNTRVLGW